MWRAAATARRLSSVADAIVASGATGGSAQQQLQLKTEAHPANQRFALGRERKLRVLTEEQLALFWENGFLVIEDLLSPDEVTSLAERTDAIARGETGNPTEVLQIEPSVDRAELSPEERVLAVRKLFNLCDTDEPMFQHASNPKIVDVIADLLGTEDIKVYGDQLFMKNPSVGSSIPWHQDSTSWQNIFPRDLVSAWTAIDHATEENGCLHFIPGSHRWGLIGPTRGNEGTEHSMSEDYMSDTERWPSVPVPLRPGSVSFHHSMTMHKSGANTSGLRRRGYAIHYMRATSLPEGEITAGAKGKMAKGYRSVRGRSFPGRV